MLAWSSVISALVRAEDVAVADSGLLAFGPDADAGGIFVERGRVAWAVARGMGRRLHEILQSHAPGDAPDFDEIYRRCRANGQLLGQTLVEEGYITPHALEVSLRRHSAEALFALGQGAHAEPIWRSRGERGYAARFTFRPLDVLLDVVALWTPDAHAAAHAVLQRFAAPGRAGGAFLAGEDVLPIAAFGELTLQETCSIGRWAAQLPAATRELGAAATLAIATTDAGETLATWWRGDVIYVVVCTDRRAIGEVMHYLGGDT